MKTRISPMLWPVLTVTSPLLIPFLIKKNNEYKENKIRASKLNEQRIKNAEQIELPEVESLEMKVLVEWKTKRGFLGDAGISYLFSTEQGSMLFDVGHGGENDALVNNAEIFDFDLNQVKSLTVSHLHKDHMGGLKAAREKTVKVPEVLLPDSKINCYLPDTAGADNLSPVIIEKPKLLNAGIATTGPLARSLFFLGHTEEQALIINIKDKGLAIFTGCGHPTIELILKMVKKISDQPIYAIGGGLHFPLTEGRGNSFGFELQRIFGTGKPPWESLSESNLKKTIDTINEVEPEKVFLSGHDSCDYSLNYFKENLKAEVKTLNAGDDLKI